MKRFTALACTLLLLCSAAMAQTQPSADSEETEDYIIPMNMAGDQYIKIALSVAFPIHPAYPQLYVGGSGTLGYHRFLTNWLAAGAEVNFGYAPTLGSNIFTYIPILLTLTAQPTLGKFEFPLTLAVGAATENYINRTYWPGLVIKPEAGVYFRLNETWSMGAEADFTWMPQWYSEEKYNYPQGCLWNITLGARYHF